MKKNLALFALLGVLLVVTYVFQEKRVERDYLEAQKRDRLIDVAITHLKLPYLEATKKDGRWWSGESLLSHNTFKLIEKKLSEIKKIKDIQGEWKNFFPHPFEFEINKEKWTIGDLALDKQGFYIAHDKKIYLAVIEGESTHLTQDESEIEGIKLNELVSSLSRSLEDLKENQLFRFYPRLPLGKVIVAAEGSLPFELDFDQNESNPRPIKGISVHRDLKGKFYSLLTQVMIKDEVSYSPKLKFKKMAEIQFKDSKRRVTWGLWLKDEKTADAYIIDDESKKAYHMIGGTLRLFFIQLQDYWDKKIIPPESFTSFSELKVPFVQGSKKALVTVMNREPLVFKVENFKVDQLKMEELFQLIFNLGPRDQGERVSNLTKTERQQLLSEEHLKISLMGQELILWRKAQELIVANLTQGFKVHFHLLNENFRGTFEDVLK